MEQRNKPKCQPQPQEISEVQRMCHLSPSQSLQTGREREGAEREEGREREGERERESSDQTLNRFTPRKVHT